MKVSLFLFTYNAPIHVFKAITSLKKTKFRDYELIVLDNRSKPLTRAIISMLHKLGYIDKVKFNNENSLFAKGNNLVSQIAEKDTTHYLHINSDIFVKDCHWRTKLASLHPAEGGSVL